MATAHGKQEIPDNATHYRHAWSFYGSKTHAYAIYENGEKATAYTICGGNRDHNELDRYGSCKEPTCRTCAKAVAEYNLQPFEFIV